MARTFVHSAACEDFKAAVQLLQHLGRGEHLRACRCQLDGQRNSLQPIAERRYRCGVPARHLEVGRRRLSPIYIQLHAWDCQKLFRFRQDRRASAAVKAGSRARRVSPASSARSQVSGAPARARLSNERGALVRKLLEVVQYDERRFIPEFRDNARGGIGGLQDLERFENGSGNMPRVPEIAKRDEPHPSVERIVQRVGKLPSAASCPYLPAL